MIDLSIITVCRNAREDLRKTMRSVLEQEEIEGLSIEYIVIDGKSSDGTVELLGKEKCFFVNKKIELIYISEEDFGIYDAMNKGIVLSRGRWIHLLNAGDAYYNSKCLSSLKKSLLLDNASEILCCGYNRIEPGLEYIVFPPKLSQIKKRMIFCHQALIIDSGMQKNNLYNTDYKIVADYDFVLKMYMKHHTFQYMDICLVNYNVYGVSGANMIKTYKESFRVRKNDNAIEDKTCAYISYILGYFKRIILSIISQNLRWRIVNTIHKAKGLSKHKS